MNNPWVDNVAQFGGANVVTGTGLSGAGIPRVTVSSDSAISISPPTVNNPWVDNVAQFGGANVVTGTGLSGAGIPRVTVSSDSAISISPPTVNNPWVDNISQFGGANVVTGQGVSGAGVPRVTIARDSVDVNNPWVDNISRFGGANVVTGQGASGAGIPRVTIAKDSVDVNSPWVDNIAQFGGANVVTGTGAGGAGVPRVTISNDSTVGITGTPNVTVVNTVNNPLPGNVSQFGGANVVTGTGAGGAGIPRMTISNDSTVGIVGTPTVTFTSVTLVATPLNIAIAPSQVASAAYLDGAITSLGSLADTAWSSGSGTLIAIAKKIANNTGGAGSNVTVVNTVNNPVPNNVSQFGGANVVTGTGPSGAGIPRVTMSNDSSISITPPTVNNPWVDNISQFGGSNVVTGTGAGGAGIPRVTISNDSTVGIVGTPTVTFNNITVGNTVNNPVVGNVAQFGGANVVTGQGVSGAGVPRVTIARDSVDVNNPWVDNISRFGGANVVTGQGASGAGIPRVTIAKDSVDVNSPWVDNIAQFGGANVVTGTGPSGAGIPRVTMSNDSSISITPPTVNNPWVDNISQFGGSNVVTGTGTGGAGIPRVTISNDSSISLNATPLNIAIAPAMVASAAYLDGAITSLGSLADTAWSAGNGTLIAIAKKIANNTAGSSSNVTVLNTVNNPVPDNVAQFGGANVVTGTGPSGAGIPRVTMSNDSSISITPPTVNNPWVDNISQFGGANVVTGQGTSGAGIPRVTIARDSVDVNNPWVDNISRFGGSNVVTGQGVSGAGIPRVTIAKDSVDVNSPWIDNISQFGGSNVVTGTGAGGAGIPRVTISNDSTVGITGTATVTMSNITIGNTVNNPVPGNVSQFGGSNVVTGTGAGGAGVPRVTISNDSTVGITGTPTVTFSNITVGNTVNNPVPGNISQFGGANVVSGTGNSGAGIPRVTVASDSGIGITSIASVATGAFMDGALTTIGARGDAVYGGGGASATVNSVLKGIYTVINNIYSFFQNGSNLIGTVNPIAPNWGLNDNGTTPVVTSMQIAAVASSSEPPKSTANQTQLPLMDLASKLVVSPYANRENAIAGSVSTSASGLQAIIATPTNASQSYYITDFGCTRNDAGTTAITVTDNSTNTAGVQGASGWAVPNSGGGGGFMKQFGVPLKVAAGKAFQINISAGVLSLMCNAQGYIGY